MKSGPHLPQLEKALAQKRRPNTAKNKLIKKKKKPKSREIIKKKKRVVIITLSLSLSSSSELYQAELSKTQGSLALSPHTCLA